METERPISILPAIKCSNCGVEIQISAMGEHECPRQEESAPVLAPLPATTFSRPMSPAVEKTASLSPPVQPQGWIKPAAKPSRMALPRIDPSVANRPYANNELLSPTDSVRSSNGLSAHSRERSPTTPHTGRPGGRSPMMRSATSPMPRSHRPPSMLMTSNMDCAFPPFPRSTPTVKPKSPAPESYFGPRSPNTAGGAQVAERMNTIAPGPFKSRTTSKTPPASSAYPPPPVINVQKAPSINTDRPITPAERAASPIERTTSPVQIYMPPQTSPPRQADSPVERPASPAMSQTSSSGSVSHFSTNREGKPVPQRPVRPEPLDGFLAMLKSESEAAADQQAPAMTVRSNTFPLPPSVAKPVDQRIDRAPSDPPQRQRRPTISAPASEETLTTTSSVSKVPKIATDLPKSSHVVHGPSDSASSTSSTHSFRSDLSPVTSASSSVSMLSTTLGDIARDADPSLRVASLQVKAKPANTRVNPDNAVRLNPVAYNRQQPISPVDETVDSPATRSSPFSAQRAAPGMELPESPIVPGFPSQGVRSPLQSTPTTPIASPPSEHGFKQKPQPSKRPATSSKHVCRGCDEPIMGKSVKAADGRLTGRYHKQCFVCKTCRSAFATADFYVIDNNPYCEHHYHELNNSLCAHCDRGIEGPYLETQQGQKFHPNCFTCLDCHKTLSDDYFEIAGKVYCEQHATLAIRRQEGLGPKRNMERRTTRFMMM